MKKRRYSVYFHHNDDSSVIGCDLSGQAFKVLQGAIDGEEQWFKYENEDGHEMFVNLDEVRQIEVQPYENRDED